MDSLLSQVIPYTLVAFRLAGVFMMAPILSGVNIPRKHKALIVFMLAAAMFPMITPLAPAATLHTDVVGLIPLVVSESIIGLAIGAIASIPLLSLEMSGVLMGQSMGLSLARVYNPDADFDADVLGQLLFYIAAGVFVAMGGLEQLFTTVAESFKNVPLGGFGLSRAPLDLFTGVLASGIELAVRVAAPVTGIVLLLVIVFGAIGKSMPQVNIMSVGFAVKIIAGLAMLTLALYAVRNAVGDEIKDTLDGALRWVRTL